MLLDAMGAPPLSDTAPQLDGFCVQGRAWVLPRALTAEDPRVDVIVHEVAHLLHELTPAELLPGTGADAERPLVRVPLTAAGDLGLRVRDLGVVEPRRPRGLDPGRAGPPGRQRAGP